MFMTQTPATTAPATTELDTAQQLVRLENINESLNRRLKLALDPAIQRRNVIADLLEEAFEQTMPSQYDVDAAFDRLVTLVQHDDDEAWLLEQDYTFTYTARVTVKGTVKASSEKHALEKVRENEFAFTIEDAGSLDDSWIDTTKEHGLFVELK